MFYGYFPPKNGSKCDSKQNACTKLFESYCVGPWKTKTNYNKETEHDLQKVTRILTLFYNPPSQQSQVRRVPRDFTLHAHCTPVSSSLLVRLHTINFGPTLKKIWQKKLFLKGDESNNDALSNLVAKQNKNKNVKKIGNRIWQSIVLYIHSALAPKEETDKTSNWIKSIYAVCHIGFSHGIGQFRFCTFSRLSGNCFSNHHYVYFPALNNHGSCCNGEQPRQVLWLKYCEFTTQQPNLWFAIHSFNFSFQTKHFFSFQIIRLFEPNQGLEKLISVLLQLFLSSHFQLVQ